MVKLRKIKEDNFIDTFNLKFAPGQEEFVSHPIRSLAQAYVYSDFSTAMPFLRNTLRILPVFSKKGWNIFGKRALSEHFSTAMPFLLNPLRKKQTFLNGLITNRCAVEKRVEPKDFLLF